MPEPGGLIRIRSTKQVNEPYDFPDCYYEISARADTENQVVELKPTDQDEPIFVLNVKELEFLVQLGKGKIDVPVWVEVDANLV
jgi:hypothetical protein